MNVLAFMNIRECVAAIAQLVEQLICNHQVRGSSPCCGTIFLLLFSFARKYALIDVKKFTF